jgi:hypothetical protein
MQEKTYHLLGVVAAAHLLRCSMRIRVRWLAQKIKKGLNFQTENIGHLHARRS